VVAGSVAGAYSEPAGAATPLWTINFTGHGTSQSDATLTSGGTCPLTDHTTVKSAFHWSVTWSHVALSTPPVTGNITGALLGTAYETETTKVSGGCTGDVNCDKTVDFSADEGLDGSNPAALLFHKSSADRSNGVLVLDLLTWADQTAQCESRDPNDSGFLVASPLSGLNPSATDPLAASATIPISELMRSGKIVVVAHKSAFSYPTAGDSDCSDTSLSLTCSQSQNWDGTITILRAG
jgi:hypothetical protein